MDANDPETIQEIISNNMSIVTDLGYSRQLRKRDTN